MYYGPSYYKLRKLPSNETKQLLISAFIIALAFSFNEILSRNIYGVIAAAIAVILAFTFHELLHRYAARKLGYYAKYQAWPTGLLLALLLSIVTLGRVVFAAPGAVVVYPKLPFGLIDRRDYGKIAASGPLANILLGYFALFLISLVKYGIISVTSYLLLLVLSYVKYINLWLAMFNLIPFPPLDGSKVFAWSKIVWLVFFAVSAIPLFILPYLL